VKLLWKYRTFKKIFKKGFSSGMTRNKGMKEWMGWDGMDKGRKKRRNR
jgi:hypothetical protein